MKTALAGAAAAWHYRRGLAHRDAQPRALRGGGLFAFSIKEAAGPGDYELRSSGCYAQGADYIRRLVANCGLTEAESFPQMIRGGSAEGIPGRVFLLRRP